MSGFVWSSARISKLWISSSYEWENQNNGALVHGFLLSSSKIRNAAYGCRLSSVGVRLVSTRWTFLACGCGRSKITDAHSVCPSFSKLLKLYWTRADVSSLSWTQVRILKNEAWRIYECMRAKVRQYKTSEPIQAILQWRLASYENCLFRNVPGEDE
jgi:hypothetical protein